MAWDEFPASLSSLQHPVVVYQKGAWGNSHRQLHADTPKTPTCAHSHTNRRWNKDTLEHMSFAPSFYAHTRKHFSHTHLNIFPRFLLLNETVDYDHTDTYKVVSCLTVSVVITEATHWHGVWSLGWHGSLKSLSELDKSGTEKLIFKSSRTCNSPSDHLRLVPKSQSVSNDSHIKMSNIYCIFTNTCRWYCIAWSLLHHYATWWCHNISCIMKVWK